MAWGTEFLNKHVAYLTAGDIDGLMDAHYHDDAEMVTFEFVLRGRDEIKQYLAVDEPAQAGAISGIDLVAYAESDDCIIFTAVVHSEKMGDFAARDALYVEDGKVSRHIALTLPPDKDIRSERA